MKVSCKSLIWIFIVSFSMDMMAQNSTDIIATVAGKPITVEEFKYIYEKNNGSSANYTSSSVNEYLDLYTKFKLKVAKAKDLKLDTIKTLKEELDGYKRQLANSYLMDKEVLETLVKQLYERKKEDLNISHIYVALGKTATAEEEAKALTKINLAYQKLQQGVTFDQVAKELSEDKNNAEKGGLIGYFTAMMPDGFYDFESTMYNTPAGSFSKVVRSSIGYHILKINSKRAARGTINVAHILIKKETENSSQLIKDAYKALNNGDNWEEIVKKFSEDNKTKGNGGTLPEVSINVFEKAFEDAAFGLKKDGEFTEPVETKIGYHIIKRLSKPEINDYSTFKKVYDPKIKKDERYEIARKSLILDIKKAGGYQLDKKLLEQFGNQLSEVFLSYKWNTDSITAMEKVLFSFGGNYKYTLGEFAEYCRKNTRLRLKYDNTETKPKQVAEMLLEDFTNEKAIDFEQSNLELKYSDFRSLMREYEEGILLFEVTKNMVWDKANEDSIGLESFYEKYRNNYMSEDRADMELVFIQTEDAAMAQKAYTYLQKKGVSKAKKKFNKKSELISTFTEKLDRSNQQFGGIAWGDGSQSKLEHDKIAKRYFYKKILKTYKPEVRPFKEVRGYVVADYQDYLEKEWVANLRQEYNVKVNNEIISKIIK